MLQVASIALPDTLSHLAIGLADGIVLLYRYLDQSIFPSSTLLPYPNCVSSTNSPSSRPSLLSSLKQPNVNKHDKDKYKDREKDNLHPFIGTTSRIRSYRA